MRGSKWLAVWVLLAMSLGCHAAAAPRILSLVSAVTDALERNGYRERLAGVDEYSAALLPEEAAIPVLARNGTVSGEAILAARIDLAYVWWYQLPATRQLERLGVQVVQVPSLRLAGLEDFFRELERTAQVKLKLPELPAQPENGRGPARIYWELYAPMQTMGRNSYLDDVLELAGWENVAAAGTGSMLLTREELLAADPEVILLMEGFGTPEELARRPGFAELRAVRSQRVYVVPRRWLVPGAALPEALDRLQQWKEAGDAVL